MLAKDIMSTPVISVAPDALVLDIAALLKGKRISGVPVLEEGRLVGIVSETDLMRRFEIATERDPTAISWWSHFCNEKRLPAEYIRSHAKSARDVMTREVVSVDESTPIAEIVDLLETRRIRRVPVLRVDTVVGVVSRSSFLEALLVRLQRSRDIPGGSDDIIHAKLLQELGSQPWWQTGMSHVRVNGGVVSFWGLVDSEAEKQAARIAAENVPGVRRVEDHRRRYSDLVASL